VIIYRFTNRTNGKVYIGQTVKTLAARKQLHDWAVRNRKGQAVHAAIRKYGWDAFDTEIIYQAKTIDELNAMETFFIILHQSHCPQNGYNRSLGGYKRKNVGQVPWNKGKSGIQKAWNKGKKMPESFREGCRTRNSANAETAAHARTFIGPHSPERNAKVSKLFSGTGNPFFGKKHSPETRAKMREAKARRRLLTSKIEA
jgi:group I intron endonuclease